MKRQKTAFQTEIILCKKNSAYSYDEKDFLITYYMSGIMKKERSR